MIASLMVRRSGSIVRFCSSLCKYLRFTIDSATNSIANLMKFVQKRKRKKSIAATDIAKETTASFALPWISLAYFDILHCSVFNYLISKFFL